MNNNTCVIFLGYHALCVLSVPIEMRVVFFLVSQQSKNNNLSSINHHSTSYFIYVIGTRSTWKALLSFIEASSQSLSLFYFPLFQYRLRFKT